MKSARSFRFILAALALIQPAWAQSGKNIDKDKEAAASKQFDQLDADKDGIVSRQEAVRMAGLPEHFDRLDTNKDGKLDALEFAALYKD